MHALIGRHKVRMEGWGLILTHPAGISFDLTLEEAKGLAEFTKSYRAALAVAQSDKEPGIESAVVDQESGSSSNKGEATSLRSRRGSAKE